MSEQPAERLEGCSKDAYYFVATLFLLVNSSGIRTRILKDICVRISFPLYGGRTPHGSRSDS
jgi:hypothetical protein